MKIIKKNGDMYSKETWKDAIILAEAKFICFHDYRKNDRKNGKLNDGCLGLLIKQVVYITNHKDKFNKTKKWIELK